MQAYKKSKTQKSPHHQIHLYNLSHKKDSNTNTYFLRSKKSTSKSRDSNGNSFLSKSISVNFKNKIKDRSADTYGFKTNRKQEKSLGNSTMDYKPVKTAKRIKNTLQTIQPSQSKFQQYNLSNLLGLSSIVSKKQSLSNSTNHQIVSEITNNEPSIQSSREQIRKLRKQNQQVMRVNQHLLYQKQYFKQKTILQEVQIRDLNRKIIDLQALAQDRIQKNKRRNNSLFQQSQLSFKLKTEQQNKFAKKKKKQLILLKAKNYGTATSKSSLLISQSDQQQILVQNKQNQKPGLGYSQSVDFIRKTQNQFASLLESVQNQYNPNRKMTLRKMLAIKAMELKKVKQNSQLS